MNDCEASTPARSSTDKPAQRPPPRSPRPLQRVSCDRSFDGILCTRLAHELARIDRPVEFVRINRFLVLECESQFRFQRADVPWSRELPKMSGWQQHDVEAVAAPAFWKALDGTPIPGCVSGLLNDPDLGIARMQADDLTRAVDEQQPDAAKALAITQLLIRVSH